MIFKQRLLSQNFFKDKNLVARLVGLANFGPNDLVVEIGAGKGIITEALARVVGHVVAVEIDGELVVDLKRLFVSFSNVEIMLADIRQFALPVRHYKVFGNIPFHIATDIVYKLLYYSNPPSESCLVLPREAAEKFSGLSHETQFSTLAKPWFDFQILQDLKRADFSPEPDVHVCLLRITKKETPLISPEEEMLYKSFIKFAFGTWKRDLKSGLKPIFSYSQWKRLADDNQFSIHSKPTDLTFGQWLAIFRFFQKGIDPAKQGRVFALSRVS
ncbi:MAG: rRNA (Adenine-N(6)-)-methyltransferase [Candidatus Nomurabacteria bacterium GW2011_GWA1_46_11]|uniref:rRNA (Adenine-N(6)-)-methyltransferase n=1 Tax=Candidatus Nomurabacteria bacterium GW2011_GWA1_46_11 TaxID=1618732 RepID=A0A0G1QX15_9BACT|nr:MAG: rRNA (Adenine-N(6)-)-methyltransferase [Microgenomates group bacterium GW2011_GWA2_44_7]KKT78295.1 MAG: rRNA (Adenine-N(6)-)-methyltransferase [Microgenomates group bacterium GW2011_GWB1_44_8]KKU22353.1 MAG: rRNA (Adenine-N(6)-)-methyltransferase [Candidatus Nomurabacteria bacterium GW2011_GWA1_46_11]